MSCTLLRLGRLLLCALLQAVKMQVAATSHLAKVVEGITVAEEEVKVAVAAVAAVGVVVVATAMATRPRSVLCACACPLM